MQTFLLNWNPKKWNWAGEGLEKDLADYEQRGFLVRDWHLGTNWRKISKGDEVYLIRLGTRKSELRGIIACGMVRSLPEQKPNHNDPTKSGWYVPVRFDSFLDPYGLDFLHVHGIKRGPIATQKWSFEASGMRVAPDAVAALRAEWANLLKETEKKIKLSTGSELSNSELSQHFKVGSQGGMRRSIDTHSLVLIADHTKSLYEDRWKDRVFHYTGEGPTGEQSFIKQNRTLAESWETGIRVHLFEVFDKGRYVYAGQVSVDRDSHYRERQLDEEGNERTVIMFPLHLKAGGEPPTPKQGSLEQITKKQKKELSRLSIDDLHHRASMARTVPGRREVLTQQIARSSAVIEYVKVAAKGRCDLCEKDAPFTTKHGEPYLECHHLVRLADGGRDSVDNAVGLCPNCHRKMHGLNLKKDLEKLQKRISDRSRSMTLILQRSTTRG